MKNTITLFSGILLFFTSSAQIYSLPGMHEWSSTSAWNGGSLPSSFDSVIIIGGSNINLDNAVVHNSDVTIENGGTLTSSNLSYDLTINSGNLTLVGANSVLDFINMTTAVPVTIINGHLINFGLFNSGALYISYPTTAFDVTMSTNNGDLFVLGGLELAGTEIFENNMNATIVTLLDIINGTEFYNNQSISVGILENKGNISNFGEITITDSLLNFLEGSILSLGGLIVTTNDLTNYGQILISDSLVVHGNLSNSGTIINDGGAINATNDLSNSGILSGSLYGQYYIGGTSINTVSGSINGLIDVCDNTLALGSYLDLDNGTTNIDFNTVTFCGISMAAANDISDSSITIYPNPSYNGKFTINYSGEILVINVIDMQGRIVHIPFDLSKETIDCSSLNYGKYHLKVETENTVIVKEIVILK